MTPNLLLLYVKNPETAQISIAACLAVSLWRHTRLTWRMSLKTALT